MRVKIVAPETQAARRKRLRDVRVAGGMLTQPMGKNDLGPRRPGKSSDPQE